MICHIRNASQACDLLMTIALTLHMPAALMHNPEDSLMIRKHPNGTKEVTVTRPLSVGLSLLEESSEAEPGLGCHAMISTSSYESSIPRHAQSSQCSRGIQIGYCRSCEACWAYRRPANCLDNASMMGAIVSKDCLKRGDAVGEVAPQGTPLCPLLCSSWTHMNR